jgi:hypothetical protein
MEKNNNEIGFVELAVKIISLVKRYYLIIICFLFIGLILGFFQSKKQGIISYKKKLVFYSNYATFPIINNFTYNIINNKYKSPSTNISIFNEKTISKIDNLFLDTLSQNGRALLQVSFVLTDTIGTSGIFTDYFNYLDSTDYNKNIRKKNKVKNSLIYDKLCVKLDELEAVQNKIKFSKNDMTIISGNSYKEYIDLYCLKLEYQEKLKNESNFEIISESVFPTLASTNRLFNCIKYGFAFLLTSFFIIFILELIKKIKLYK